MDLNYLQKFHISDSKFSSVSNNGACHFTIVIFSVIITAVLRKMKHPLFYILSMFLTSFYDDRVSETQVIGSML
jgi:hypothetical protein